MTLAAALAEFRGQIASAGYAADDARSSLDVLHKAAVTANQMLRSEHELRDARMGLEDAELELATLTGEWRRARSLEREIAKSRRRPAEEVSDYDKSREASRWEELADQRATEAERSASRDSELAWQRSQEEARRKSREAELTPDRARQSSRDAELAMNADRDESRQEEMAILNAMAKSHAARIRVAAAYKMLDELRRKMWGS